MIASFVCAKCSHVHASREGARFRATGFVVTRLMFRFVSHEIGGGMRKRPYELPRWSIERHIAGCEVTAMIDLGAWTVMACVERGPAAAGFGVGPFRIFLRRDGPDTAGGPRVDARSTSRSPALTRTAVRPRPWLLGGRLRDRRCARPRSLPRTAEPADRIRQGLRGAQLGRSLARNLAVDGSAGARGAVL